MRNVGDKVKIKSLEWYNDHKSNNGNVDCGYDVFTEDMSTLCGKTMTIKKVLDDYYLLVDDKNVYNWTDEMFEDVETIEPDNYIQHLSQQWCSDLHNKEFNSTSEEMCFQSYAYQDGYKKGFKDALHKICERLDKVILQTYDNNAGNKIGRLVVSNQYLNKNMLFHDLHKLMDE